MLSRKQSLQMSRLKIYINIEKRLIGSFQLLTAASIGLRQNSRTLPFPFNNSSHSRSSNNLKKSRGETRNCKHTTGTFSSNYSHENLFFFKKVNFCHEKGFFAQEICIRLIKCTLRADLNSDLFLVVFTF